MKIIYIHHALRAVGNPPTQNDGIQPLGIKDAETTAELLKEMSDKSKSTFRAIYTSPYYRCSETAKLINKYINLPIYEEPRFNEFNKVFEVIQGDKSITKTERKLFTLLFCNEWYYTCVPPRAKAATEAILFSLLSLLDFF